MDGFEIRRLSAAEAQARGDRLRAIFREAVQVAGPAFYTGAQVAAWSSSADDVERWKPWLADGATWIATTRDDADHVVGYALRVPADHLHLLYVDPAFHRRGLGRALLAAADDEARDEGVAWLDAEASAFSQPVFAAAGYAVVREEEVERNGVVFRRTCMRKVLR